MRASAADTGRANGRSDLIKDAPSKAFVTYQEVEIPMIKDQVVSIFYDRKGSAGPYGFIEGRKVELVWDGK